MSVNDGVHGFEDDIFAQILLVIEEEEADFEEMMLAIAGIAAQEMMDLEEGVVGGGGGAATWFYFSVDMDEYRQLGDPWFKMHFRMSRGVFEILVETVHNHLLNNGRLERERRPMIEIMLIVLWIMATPDSFRSVASRFSVTLSTVWYFYSYIIEALRELAPTYIRWPNARERNAIKTAFREASGFPGVVGCIDCTHCQITAPVHHARQYVNRHHVYSINVQCVVDHDLIVRHLHVGEVRSMHDNRVFRRSRLRHMLLQRGEERIVDIDEHIVGDGGYTLTDYLLIPYENNGRLTPEQRNFNRRLSQCRVRVENAFGRAKMQWRRLMYLHARNHTIFIDHLTASFVLHNFIVLHGEQLWEDGEWEAPIHDDEVLGNEDFNDGVEDDEVEDPDLKLHVAAQMRGEEKRVHIMNEVLP